MCRYFAFFLTALPILGFLTIDNSKLYATLSAKKDNKEFFTGILDGDVEAQKEIVILSSLSCHSCKDFHQKTYEKLVKYAKENHIKLRVEFYIETAGTLEFVKIINMGGISKKTKMSLAKSVFAAQDHIDDMAPNGQSEFIRKLARDLGIDSKKLDELAKDKDFSKRVLEKAKIVNKSIKSDILPTIMVKNSVYEDEVTDFDKLVKFIEKNL